MALALEVNKKTYLPSVALAKEFGYTSDYISKLARDERVLGTRVGRQWFVEPESLRMYIHQLEVEKKIQKEELSQQRKLERVAKLQASDPARQPEPAVMVGGKSAVVVLCGLIVGMLGLTYHTYGLHVTDLATGAQSILTQVATRVGIGLGTLLPDLSDSREVVATTYFSGQLSPVTHPELTGHNFQTDGTYTIFPTAMVTIMSILGGEQLASDFDDRSASYDEIGSLPFADEVTLEIAGESMRVRPVFRDSAGDLYELSASVVGEEN